MWLLNIPTYLWELGRLGTEEKLTAEQVRELFPECVAFADEVRDAFGGDVKMIYASEGGKEIGRLSDQPGDKTVRGDRLVIGSGLSELVKCDGKGRRGK